MPVRFGRIGMATGSQSLSRRCRLCRPVGHRAIAAAVCACAENEEILSVETQFFVVYAHSRNPTHKGRAAMLSHVWSGELDCRTQQ